MLQGLTRNPLADPGIVGVYEYGEDEKMAFIVMEYVEGQTLRDLLNELEQVPEELCRHIGREIAKGLVAIHDAGVIHRDLKPENVLVSEEGQAILSDFETSKGEASSASSARISATASCSFLRCCSPPTR